MLNVHKAFMMNERLFGSIVTGAMMAATNFALRNLCLILLLCSGFLSLFHHVGTAKEHAL